jgi:hypothetical protein
VEHYLRQATDRWLLTEIHDRQHTLDLSSVSCKLALVDVYEEVLEAQP